MKILVGQCNGKYLGKICFNWVGHRKHSYLHYSGLMQNSLTLVDIFGKTWDKRKEKDIPVDGKEVMRKDGLIGKEWEMSWELRRIKFMKRDDDDDVCNYIIELLELNLQDLQEKWKYALFRINQKLRWLNGFDALFF